jgi:hypothetical protein
MLVVVPIIACLTKINKIQTEVMTGQLKLQRHAAEAIFKQFEDAEYEEATCAVAALKK